MLSDNCLTNQQATTGELQYWDGEPTNAEPEVHGELAWFDPDNPPENTVPAVRFYLQQIKSGNAYSEYGWPKT